MQELGRTLVAVPCWWKGDIQSLIGSIQFQRPDLFTQHEPFSPIPANPPQLFFYDGQIPGVGSLMLASVRPGLLVELVSPTSPWWIGEKFDGVRACWNANLLSLYTRHGVHLALPDDNVTRSFPTTFLDGELWFGRNSFSDSQSFVFSPDNPSRWAFLRFIVFDVPSPEFNATPFEERYGLLLSTVPSEHPFIAVVSRSMCGISEKLDELADQVIAHEGEGLMLRKPRSLYEPGKSHSLIKLKALRDSEAMVVDVLENDLYQLKLPNGMLFSAELDNSTEDEYKPKPGDVVTFEYISYSKGPVHPRIIRVRSDMTWENVVDNYVKYDDPGSSFEENEDSFDVQNSWDLQDRRTVLSDIAKQTGFDPLNPQNWYSLSERTLMTIYTKIKDLLFSYYGGDYTTALAHVYPEIGLEKNRFSIPAHKLYFYNFAMRNQFDPLVASNWYSVTVTQFCSHKGGRRVLKHYNKSLSKALLTLFPDIGLEKTKFRLSKYWTLPQNQKQLLIQFARDNQFDPLVAENWYKVTRKQCHSYRGLQSVLEHCGGLRNALLQLFPDIGLQGNKFNLYNFCDDETNQKQFFIEYARDKKFDPLVPENWYSVKSSQVHSYKGGTGILRHYNNSMSKALMQLFPDIGLEKARFNLKNYWDIESNQKQALIQFARANNIDPLVAENWYSVSTSQFSSTKGGHSVLYYYNGSLQKALLHLFPDIGLEKTEFSMNKMKDSHKHLFIDFAQHNQFDPLVPEPWYSVTRKDFSLHNGGHHILKHYNYSLSKALLRLFPDIGLEKSKFNFKHHRIKSEEYLSSYLRE